MVKKPFPLSKVYQLLEPGPVIMVTTELKGKPNIMTMAWHMMVEFEPPLIAFVMSDQNYSFKALKTTKECVINIPTADLVRKAVRIGETTGSKIDKFTTFHLTAIPASRVNVPMIEECYANIECKVVDTKLVSKYNIFILQAVKAWITPSKKRPDTLHHWGNGLFTVDGKKIKLPFSKK
jgi:flavin reductase (DIM6/NTAB) family NADH-FMN oxidoreductase RutF